MLIDSGLRMYDVGCSLMAMSIFPVSCVWYPIGLLLLSNSLSASFFDFRFACFPG